MTDFDVRNLTDARREELAWHVHGLDDVTMPRLSAWNYDLCRQHRNGWEESYYDDVADEDKVRLIQTRPKPGCRKCGLHLRKHQRKGATWLYLKKRALLADTMGAGKAQAVSEPVLTPLGWKAIGGIEVGDSVIGSSGAATRVSGVYPQESTEVVRVNFNDGSWVRCSPDHLWSVQRVSGGRNYVVTTRELMEGPLRGKGGAQNLVWAIPQVSPVNFFPVVLPTDPYALGVWLGDGSSRSISLNAEDASDIKTELSRRGVSLPEGRESHGDRAFSFRSALLPEAVRGKRSWEKFVPQEFLLASIDDRLSLLQGLLDTDGSPMRNGDVEYSTTSPQLRDDVVFLTQSLGGVARVGKSRCTTYPLKGKEMEGRESYRVNVKLPPELNPFAAPRKLGTWLRPTKYLPRRLIKSIVPDTSESTVCIRVEAEDSLYVTRDFIVTHNTPQIGALIALLLETGEVPQKGRVVIVPRSPALFQWYTELLRMMPSLNVIISRGTRNQRSNLYVGSWDVLLIGPEMLRGKNGKGDIDFLKRFPIALLVTDDVDQLRNDNDTSFALDSLGYLADRYVIVSGTPLQKRLPELYNVLDGIGGERLFGSIDKFMSRYVRVQGVQSYDPKAHKDVTKKQIVGYRNLSDLKRRMAPIVLRRTAADLDDVTLPTINSEDVYLDLYPAQRARYQDLQRNVVRLIKEDGQNAQKHVTALSKIHYGAAICAGLTALDGLDADLPGTSVKLDWIIDKVSPDGDLGEEKVVIFANLKNTVRALQARLSDEGVGFVTVWGEESKPAKRAEAQERFWTDPNCRVLIGTKAIEQSLNLQVSRHLINVDMILNPARMEQLAGRIRRDGSAYQHVFVHNLIASNTQEERYLAMIERESALSSHVWEENSELFKMISPLALLQLISGE